MTNDPLHEQLFCEHLKYSRKTFPISGYTFDLGSTQLVHLCEKCKKAVAYDLITEFNRHSMPFPRYQIR